MANNFIFSALRDKNFKIVAQQICRDERLLKECMDLFFNAEDIRFNQQFSNVLQIMKKDYQSILKPYYTEWIHLLEFPKNDTLHRNTYRYFEDVNIPKNIEGKLYDLAFNDFQKIENAIAIRVFAMTTCFNIAKSYIDLLPELKEAIKIASISDSPGIKSRSKNLIFQIEKNSPLL